MAALEVRPVAGIKVGMPPPGVPPPGVPPPGVPPGIDVEEPPPPPPQAARVNSAATDTIADEIRSMFFVMADPLFIGLSNRRPCTPYRFRTFSPPPAYVLTARVASPPQSRAEAPPFVERPEPSLVSSLASTAA